MSAVVVSRCCPRSVCRYNTYVMNVFLNLVQFRGIYVRVLQCYYSPIHAILYCSVMWSLVMPDGDDIISNRSELLK